MSRAENGIKQCARCRETKPVGAFAPRSAARDGRQSYCRQCNSAQQAQVWAALSPEQRVAKNKLANNKRIHKLRREGRNAHRAALEAALKTQRNEGWAQGIRWALDEVERG